MVAGAASGKKFLNPVKLTGSATIGETGVDEIASAILEFDNDIVAEVSTAILQDMKNNAIIEGNEGYQKAKNIMKTLMPENVKKIKKFRGKIPLFH